MIMMKAVARDAQWTCWREVSAGGFDHDMRRDPDADRDAGARCGPKLARRCRKGCGSEQSKSQDLGRAHAAVPWIIPRCSITQLPGFASRAAKQWTKMDRFVRTNCC